MPKLVRDEEARGFPATSISQRKIGKVNLLGRTWNFPCFGVYMA